MQAQTRNGTKRVLHRKYNSIEHLRSAGSVCGAMTLWLKSWISNPVPNAQNQVQIRFLSFGGRSSECQELLRTCYLKAHWQQLCKIEAVNSFHKKGVKMFFFWCSKRFFQFVSRYLVFFEAYSCFYVTPENSFSPTSVLVEVCSTNIIHVSSSRFCLAKRWFSSD